MAWRSAPTHLTFGLMLVALLDGARIEASRTLQHGLAYKCPGFDHPLLLKAGEKRIAHFAHRPGDVCDWDRGETAEHRQSKKHFRDAFVARGLRAELEYVVDCLPGDRRADVMVWSPTGRRVAVELQHTPISEWEIDARVSAYARSGISQIWIPLLRENTWDAAVPSPGQWLVERYSPRPFERWLHTNMPSSCIWYYHPRRGLLWQGRFSACLLWQEETEWFGEGGEEMYGGGYHRESARWVELRLDGPFALGDLRLITVRRSRWGCATFVNAR